MSNSTTRQVDLVIVGAGFAGRYQLHRARGRGLKTQVLGSGDCVGGTLYWNLYPGARCDVESLDYSYSFSEELQQEWNWSERYAPQAEILRYINHVADRFDLRRDIQLETRVASATFDEASARWTVLTEAGERFDGQYLIMATGCLSIPQPPKFKGLEARRRPCHWTERALQMPKARGGAESGGRLVRREAERSRERGPLVRVLEEEPHGRFVLSVRAAEPRCPFRA